MNIFHRWLFLALTSSATMEGWAQEAERSARTIYSAFCANCHGGRIMGNTGPNLLDDYWIHGGDDESVARSIAIGYPDRAMPGFGAALSAAEIRSLVAFLRERRAAEARTSPTQPLPEGVITTERHNFRLETVASGLATPWSIVFLPDGRALVAEKPGTLRVLERGRLLPEAIRGTPFVRDDKEGGLLDGAIHPEYSANGWIYLSYADPASDSKGQPVSHTVVVRGRIRDGAWVDQQTIWKPALEFYQPGGIMYGCRLAFDGKGFLYFTLGDRGSMGGKATDGEAQNLSRPNGKIHRVHDDGRIPSDNPFATEPGAIKSIWAYGSRNAQGLAFEPRTGVLWETEHGPKGGDELNIVRRGANYGWPLITYGTNYDGSVISEQQTREGMEAPVLHWTPSIAAGAIAFYESEAFPNWKHQLFVTSLAQQELRRLVIADGRVASQEVLLKDIGRLRDIAIGPDGCIYLAVNSPALIVRLVPAELAR